MNSYLMLGKYTISGISRVSAARTHVVEEIVNKFGGELQTLYALMGDWDLALIVDFPDNESAMKSAVALRKYTDIIFSTYPAVSIDEFDKSVTDMFKGLMKTSIVKGEPAD